MTHPHSPNILPSRTTPKYISSSARAIIVTLIGARRHSIISGTPREMKERRPPIRNVFLIFFILISTFPQQSSKIRWFTHSRHIIHPSIHQSINQSINLSIYHRNHGVLNTTSATRSATTPGTPLPSNLPNKRPLRFCAKVSNMARTSGSFDSTALDRMALTALSTPGMDATAWISVASRRKKGRRSEDGNDVAEVGSLLVVVVLLLLEPSL